MINPCSYSITQSAYVQVVILWHGLGICLIFILIYLSHQLNESISLSWHWTLNKCNEKTLNPVLLDTLVYFHYLCSTLELIFAFFISIATCSSPAIGHGHRSWSQFIHAVWWNMMCWAHGMFLFTQMVDCSEYIMLYAIDSTSTHILYDISQVIIMHQRRFFILFCSRHRSWAI
jgi:hypothetical protein